MTVEDERFHSLDADQRRETVDTCQRFDPVPQGRTSRPGALSAWILPHLPIRPEDLRSFPRDVVPAAAPLFAGERAPDARFDG